MSQETKQDCSTVVLGISSGPIPQHHKMSIWIAACLCVLYAESTQSRDTLIARSTRWLQCC